MKMNILFLDIDGVMNSSKHRAYLASIGIKEMIMRSFDPEAVGAFNWLLNECDFYIVVSSSWRSNWTLPDLRKHFSEQGVEQIERIIDYTPKIYRKRGKEIQLWLDEHPCHSFVILDDASDMLHLKTHLVQTDFENGLTMKEAKEIARRFNEQEKEKDRFGT